MRKIRGGSLSSDYVNQLCQLNNDNLTANQIMKGGSHSKSSKSMQVFDNYVYSMIQGGASAQQVVKSVQHVLQEKKNHKMSQYLLNDFVQRHSSQSVHGGKKKNKNSRRRKNQHKKQTKHRRRVQRGGANADGSMENDINYLYTDTNEYRGTTGDSNILTGSSVPPTMYQKFMDWFNGKTTIFTPSMMDVTNQPSAQLQCSGNSCSVSTVNNVVPNFENSAKVGTIVDPKIDGGEVTVSAFPSIAIDNSIGTVLPTLSRA